MLNGSFDFSDTSPVGDRDLQSHSASCHLVVFDDVEVFQMPDAERASSDRGYFRATQKAILKRYLKQSLRNVGILAGVVYRTNMSASVDVVGMWARTRCSLQRPVFGLQMGGAKEDGSWRLGIRGRRAAKFAQSTECGTHTKLQSMLQSFEVCRAPVTASSSFCGGGCCATLLQWS